MSSEMGKSKMGGERGLSVNQTGAGQRDRTLLTECERGK